MRRPTRPLLIVAALLLTAAPASAWHHRYMAPMPMMPMMPAMPMMGMGMMPMPMMGVGMMPSLPMMGVMPTSVVGGGGMSMQLGLSGDLATILMMPGLLRSLFTQFLGAPATAGMTDAQIQRLAQQILTGLNATGGGPMTQDQGKAIIAELQKLQKAIQDAVKTKMGEDTTTSSPEVEKARAAVRQLVVQGAARNGGRRLSVEQARAQVRQLVAKGTARSAGRTAPDVERARAEVRRLVAEGAARKAGAPRPPAVIRVAGEAR